MKKSRWVLVYDPCEHKIRQGTLLNTCEIDYMLLDFSFVPGTVILEMTTDKYFIVEIYKKRFINHGLETMNPVLGLRLLENDTEYRIIREEQIQYQKRMEERAKIYYRYTLLPE